MVSWDTPSLQPRTLLTIFLVLTYPGPNTNPKPNYFPTNDSSLQKYSIAEYTIYAAFSAASNVTGILTDTVAVAELCHKYGALSFWDYATAAPYLKMDMNPTETGLVTRLHSEAS